MYIIMGRGYNKIDSVVFLLSFYCTYIIKRNEKIIECRTIFKILQRSISRWNFVKLAKMKNRAFTSGAVIFRKTKICVHDLW